MEPFIQAKWNPLLKKNLVQALHFTTWENFRTIYSLILKTMESNKTTWYFCLSQNAAGKIIMMV